VLAFERCTLYTFSILQISLQTFIIILIYSLLYENCILIFGRIMFQFTLLLLLLLLLLTTAEFLLIILAIVVDYLIL